MPDVSAGERA